MALQNEDAPNIPWRGGKISPSRGSGGRRCADADVHIAGRDQLGDLGGLSLLWASMQARVAL